MTDIAPPPRIVKAGHPALARKSDPVADPKAPEIAQLVTDMAAALDKAGGVGLAAPQIGVPLRVVIFFVPERRVTDHPDDGPVGPTILINPEIEPLDGGEAQDWEGCLSIPGMRGMVPRHQRIRYRGVDLAGRPIERVAGGFHARVVQHECDHLDGTLYPARMTDLTTLAYIDEVEAARKAAEEQQQETAA